jgi:hypothetical protein
MDKWVRQLKEERKGKVRVYLLNYKGILWGFESVRR